MASALTLWTTDAPSVQVGKIDHDIEFAKEKVEELHRQIPSEFDGLPKVAQFWEGHFRDSLNGADGQGMRFTTREVVGLMGAHTMMDNQGCTEQGCGGLKKSLVWNVDWYIVRSCLCVVPPPPYAARPLADCLYAACRCGHSHLLLARAALMPALACHAVLYYPGTAEVGKPHRIGLQKILGGLPTITGCQTVPVLRYSGSAVRHVHAAPATDTRRQRRAHLRSRRQGPHSICRRAC